MSLETQAIAIVQIVITAFLSMLIGLERERSGKSAGLRTHMLAGVGACMYTVLSMHAFAGPDNDGSRVASNIVTGIGFLGAGVIVHKRGTAYSLTTAASIWATAGIGMAVGTGALLLALGATLVMWIILEVLHRLSRSEEGNATPPISHKS